MVAQLIEDTNKQTNKSIDLYTLHGWNVWYVHISKQILERIFTYRDTTISLTYKVGLSPTLGEAERTQISKPASLSLNQIQKSKELFITYKPQDSHPKKEYVKKHL